MYQSFVFKLDSGKSDILDKGPNKDNLRLSSTVNIPLNSLGFHTFISRTNKSAHSIINKLDSKNDFYNVVNPFEPIISNYEDSLENLTKIYLNNKKDSIAILSRSFYKLWEIMFLFEIADKKDLKLVSIAKGMGSFVQAVINYREKLGYGISNDKIYGITSHDDKEHEKLEKFYNSKVSGLLNIHKTFSTSESLKSTSKDDGDITKVKTINLFKKDIEKSKKYADLVTADGTIDSGDKLFEEQEGYQLILGEIITGLSVQAKDGNFVLKIFETFTMPTIKLIYLLSSFYDQTYIYKPFFSRNTESEKYIICKGFKYDQNKDSVLLNKKIKTLENVLEGMNSNKFVFDIFHEMELPDSYIDKFKFMNYKITNKQQIMNNDIIVYIKENNYFGDKFHKYKENQIEATKWWVNNFYPPSNNLYIKNKEDLRKALDNTLRKYTAEQDKFISTIVK